MQDYKIIINGKERVVKACTAEMAVRGEMCWHSGGTFFTVIDSENKASVFQKVTMSDPVTGYSGLIQIA